MRTLLFLMHLRSRRLYLSGQRSMEVLDPMDAHTPVSHAMQETLSLGADSSAVTFINACDSSDGGRISSPTSLSASSTSAQSSEALALSSGSSPAHYLNLDDDANRETPPLRSETMADAYRNVLGFSGSKDGSKWDEQESGDSHADNGSPWVCKCSGALTGDVAAVCCCPLSLLHLLAMVCFRCPMLCASRTVKKVRSFKVAKEHEDEEEPDLADECEGPELTSKSNRSSGFSQRSQSTVDEKFARTPAFHNQHNYFFPSPF